jgi:putative DNA primase/helicase
MLTNNHFNRYVNPDLIPQQLKEIPNWVIWTVEERDGKPTKVPLNPKTEGGAQSNNPKTWASFDKALEVYKTCENERIAGLGFVFSKDDDYSGTDLDKCRNPQTGAIEPWAMEVIESLNSYSEISPSGTGIKIFTKGSLPLAGSGNKNGNVEMYHRRRFFTVTGWHLEGTPLTVEPRQEELKKIYTKYFGHRKASPIDRVPTTPINASDSELIEKAKQASNGDKFCKLWKGVWRGEYLSQSEADLALCFMLAFWTGGDPERIDRLFRQSKLMRTKWDERHFGDGRTYGQATIQRAIEQTTEVYSPVSPVEKVTQTEEEGLLKYHLTDAGNAETFYEQHGKDFIFIKEKGIWVKYDGVRWGEAKEEIKREMIQTMRLKSQAAMKGFPPDSEQMKQIVKWCLGSESNFRLSAAMEIAKIYSTRSYNEFDIDPWLLTCKNGVVDLRTGELKQASRNNWLYRSTLVRYDIKAKCPLWLQFLSEIFKDERELIDFIHRAIGYTLTGLTIEQVLFILFGVGANGKSVFLGILEKLLGEYSVTTPSSTFKDQSHYDGIPNDLARMAGARFVKAIELKESTRVNEERIKALTGGDRITARFLHNEFFEFTPICKFWIAVNHKPIIRGTDEAIWRRIRLIPFEISFPADKQDKKLLEKLLNELPGILAWGVQGCLEWQKRGLEPVAKVRDATDQYRSESDQISNFLEEKTVKTLTGEVKASDLFNAYKNWCSQNNEYEITSTQFGKKMVEKGFSKEKRTYVFYKGLELVQ